MSAATPDVDAIVTRLQGALEQVRELETELVAILELADPEPVLDDDPEPQLPFEADT